VETYVSNNYIGEDSGKKLEFFDSLEDHTSEYRTQVCILANIVIKQLTMPTVTKMFSLEILLSSATFHLKCLCTDLICLYIKECTPRRNHKCAMFVENHFWKKEL